jgi:putative acyl-CoA dehydrogenase
MRLALANAIHHCRHRRVFQKHLIDQPLMQHVLADMALDVEAATALAFRLARAFDRAEEESEAAWRRLMTPVTKYWVCKMGPALGYEALECLGGNGYVEAGLAARLYRELPLNAIWEGSGNVMALDLLRVLEREPETFAAVLDALAALAGPEPTLRAELERLHALSQDPAGLMAQGRDLIESLARLAAGALLRAEAPAAVGDAFLGTRFSRASGRSYGHGLAGADTRAIVERALAS